MITFMCRNCGYEVTNVISERVPEDELCIECYVMTRAPEEAQPVLARIFNKPLRTIGDDTGTLPTH